MKKVLMIFLAIALVFTMSAPVFAADLTLQQKFDELKAAGILAGDANGNMLPADKTMTRQELAKIACTLSGVAPTPGVEIAAFAKDYKKNVWGFDQGWIQAAYTSGLMKGKGATGFDSQGVVSIAELLTVVIRTMGLGAQLDNSKWEASAMEVAIANKLIPAAGVTAKEPATYAALVTQSYNSYEYQEAQKAFKVLSVTPISAKQLEIKFNKAVDRATAFTSPAPVTVLNTTNIVLNPLDSNAAGVLNGSLSKDGKTLTVKSTNALAKRYDVIVKNLKTADNELIEPYNQLITIAADKTAPTIVSSVKKSASTYLVTFSEPMNSLGTVTYKFDDNTVATVTNTFTTGDEEVTFTLDAGIAVGKNVTATLIGAQDEANNIISPNPATLVFTKGALDGVKPTVSSITQTGAKSFDVKFSEELLAAPTVTISGTASPVVTVTKNVTDATKYKVTTTNALDGAATVAVSNFKDLSGEVGLTVSTVVTFVKDATPPMLASGSVYVDPIDLKEYLELPFTTDVELSGAQTVAITATAGTSSYTKNYVTTPITTSTSVTAADFGYKNVANKSVLKVPLDKLLAGVDVKDAAYKIRVTFGNVISGAGTPAQNIADITFTRGEDGVAGNVAVVGVATAAVQGIDNNQVEVVFDKELDGPTATNIANYTVGGAVVDSITLLPLGADTPKGTTVAATQQAVIINLKPGSNLFTGVRNVGIANVKAKGSSVSMNPYSVNISLNENVVPTITSVKLTAVDTIRVTFSEAIITSKTTQFSLDIGGIASGYTLTNVVTGGGGATFLDLNISTDITAGNISAGLTLKAITFGANALAINDAAGNKVSIPAYGIPVTQ